MHEHEFPRNLCGRSVTWNDVQMIRELIREHPSALRTELSRKVCLAWNWVKPDGGLKEMSCRNLLLKLHRAGAIELPAPQNGNNNGRKFLQLTAEGEPGEPIHTPVGALHPIELERIQTKADSFLWNELMERYHYLGYTPLPGAQIRYFIRSSTGRLGAIGFSAAALESAASRHMDWLPDFRAQTKSPSDREQLSILDPALGELEKSRIPRSCSLRSPVIS